MNKESKQQQHSSDVPFGLALPPVSQGLEVKDSPHGDTVLARLNVAMRRHNATRRVAHRDAQYMLQRLWQNERWSADGIRRSGQGETEERASSKPTYAPNLLRQVIHPMTYLYDASPTRKINPSAIGEDAAQALTDLLRDKLWDYEDGLSAAMNALDWKVRLHGTVLVAPSFAFSKDYCSGEVSGGQVVLDRETCGVRIKSYLPYEFEVVVDPSEPSRVIGAVLFPFMDEWDADTFSSSWSGSMALEHQSGVYMDNKVICRTRGFTLASAPIEHGLGRLPFTVVHNEKPSTGFWSWGIGGAGCVSDMRDIADLWREYAFTTLCARGLLFADGPVKSNVIGPDLIIELMQGGRMGSLSVAPNLGPILSSIEAMQTSWARSNNIPESLARLSESSSGNLSGRAMILQTAELEDDRPTRERIFLSAEREIHDIALRMLRVVKIIADAPSPSCVGVEFGTFLPKLSHAEALNQAAFELKNKLAGAREVKRALHPGISDAEIDALLAEAQAPQPLNEDVNTNAPAQHASDPAQPPSERDANPLDGPAGSEPGIGPNPDA